MPHYDLGFVGYSPLHAIYAFHLLKENIDKKKLVIGWEGFHNDLEKYCLSNKDIKYEKIVSPPYVAQLLQIKEKIKCRKQIFKQLKGLSFKNFYTCNELSPESIFLENATSFKKGYIFDEGFLRGTVALEKTSLKQKVKKVLRDFLNFRKKSRFDNPIYATLYSNDVTFFKHHLLHKPVNTLPIKRYLKEIAPVKLEDFYNLNEVIFLITSPLTENGNAKFHNQELVLLKKFVRVNSDKTFILKPHYRENYETKYKSLFDFKNCNLIELPLLKAPCNEIAFGRAKVVGFHSSALVELIEKNHSEVYSLSKFVGSSHSKVILESLNKKIQILNEMKLD